MAEAKISRRHGIKWADEAYGEPSSTLVLSSPSGQFVDLRLNLKSPHHLSNPEEDSKCSYKHRFECNSDFQELEWSIAGTASYSAIEGAPDDHQHGKWTHWISNRTPNPTFDEGRNQPLKNGTTLETGTMEHPDNKVPTAYREIWTEVPLRIPPPTIGAQVAGGKRSYAVIKCDAEGVQGLVIWVGQYCQGIVRNGDEVASERWEYDFDAKDGKGEWIRTFRTGSAAVPCGFLVMEGEKIEKGAELSVPDFEGPMKFPSPGEMAKWIVVEEDFTK